MPQASADLIKAAQSKRDAGEFDVEDIAVEPARVSKTCLTFETDTRHITTLKNGAASRFDSAADFDEHGVESTPTPCRIYRSPNQLIDVIVPESYAGQLDPVREIRRQLEMETSSERLE
jgi:hypothetical protein